jgi:hypothetical protein
MDKSGFVFVTKFRIDIIDFKIYKHTDGRYLAKMKYTDSGEKSEEIYVDYQLFEDVFSDDLTKEQLKYIKES